MALLHEQLDHINRALGHAVGELLDRDGFRYHYFTNQLFLGLVRGVPLEPLHTAAECGYRALALFISAQRSDQRQAPATLLANTAGGLGRRCRPCSAGTAARARSLFLFLFLCRTSGSGARWLLAETLLCFLFGLELRL